MRANVQAYIQKSMWCTVGEKPQKCKSGAYIGERWLSPHLLRKGEKPLLCIVDKFSLECEGERRRKRILGFYHLYPFGICYLSPGEDKTNVSRYTTHLPPDV